MSTRSLTSQVRLMTPPYGSSSILRQSASSSSVARFASFRYNTNQKNLGDNYVHLTNVAVQKTGPG